ncbi:MAG: Rieske 2Fe-2S domain-containing protein [Burkholderiaceae bacterium]
MSGAIDLGAAATLVDGGPGLCFEVRVGGERSSAFVVRHGGVLYGYLNRCAHVPMELDWQPGVFFDVEGEYLMCATHGALYEPASGRCVGGPCAGRGGLMKLVVEERAGRVVWTPSASMQPA